MSQIYNIACQILTLFSPVKQDFLPVQGNTMPIARVNDAAQILARRNATRSEIWLHNASEQVLFVGLTDDISLAKYALRIAPTDTLVMNAVNYASMYKEELYGFWEAGADASSKAMITELYKITGS